MTKGITAARVSILRQSWADGTLNPGFTRILDEFEEGWREDPTQSRWDEAYLDYTEWASANNRVPAHRDAGAAGLRSWIDSQTTGLDVRQLRLLELCPGWVGDVSSEVVQPLFATLASLAAVGVKPSRARSAASFESAVAAWVATNDVPPATTGWSGVTRPELRRLATFLLFVARHGRTPGMTEPGGQWVSRIRTSGAPAKILAVLDMVMGWEDDSCPVFTGGAARYETLVHRNKRTPRLRSADAEERFCARWAARQQVKARRGVLAPKQAAGLARLVA